MVLTPIQAFLAAVHDLPQNSLVEYSKYTYKPNNISDEREIFGVRIEKLEETLEKEEAKLKPNIDIAIHSRVVTPNGEFFHVPMADLIRKKPSDMKIVAQILPDYSIDEAIFFDSGNSYHMYGIGVIPQKLFAELQGKLLAAENIDGKLVVDSRWCGHRLLAEYDSLRITCNQSKYKQEPKFVRAIHPKKGKLRLAPDIWT